MPTLVEIGPSNASQGQHRRKKATKYLKKLTLARSRTQDPAYPAQVRYRYATGAVAYPEFFILFKLSSPQTYFAASWVRLLASVNFFNYFVASFLLCCPCEALEGPISTRVGIILTTTLIQSRHIINKNCFSII